MTDRFQYDESMTPIVRIDFPTTLDSATNEAHRLKMLELYQKHGPMIVIAQLDALLDSGIAPRERKVLAENADVLAERGGIVAELVVVSSHTLRLLMTAHFWLRTSKSHPRRAFSTYEEALAAAEDLARINQKLKS